MCSFKDHKMPRCECHWECDFNGISPTERSAWARAASERDVSIYCKYLYKTRVIQYFNPKLRGSIKNRSEKARESEKYGLNTNQVFCLRWVLTLLWVFFHLCVCLCV